MGEDWSREEVEATVADYFEMLDKELRCLDYNKTAHRRYLSTILNNRTDGAIERKHQNISAVLIELGFPYISGYKPLRNYQQLLYEIVSSRLETSRNLLEIVKNQIEQPAVVPSLDDILASLIDPPTPETIEGHRVIGVREKPTVKYAVDYLAQEARNHSLGTAGEQFVINFEKARLIHAGKDRLASRIEHVSLTQGDSTGFDVLSFEITGSERLIEVKTTAYGVHTPFFVTSNELDVSRNSAPGYYLYRTFNFRRQPKLFMKQGALDQSFNLDPTQYVARLI